MRSATTAVALLLIASVAAAFDGFEHRDVSNAALALARNFVYGVPPEMEMALLELSGTKHTFGDLTVAVDWFQDITKLTHHGRAWDEIGRRQRAYIWHGVALHRNDRHFQHSALCVYKKLHAQAVALAAADAHDDALYSEAVALHFLQDFLAAGHFVTPRAHSHDAVSGSLHDHFNRTGVPIELSPCPGPLCEDWTALRRAFAEQIEGMPGTTLKFMRYDACELEQRERGAVDATFLIGGDNCLLESPAHRALLVILSAASVKQVLAASRGDSAPAMEVCFTQRWALRDPRNKAWPSPVSDSHRAPQGSVGWRQGVAVVASKDHYKNEDLLDGECADVVGSCERPAVDPVSWLATYQFEQDKETMKIGIYTTNALQFAVARSHDSKRQMANIGWIIAASDPRGSVAIREERPEGSGNFEETGGHFMNFLLYSNLTIQFSAIQGERYRALGFDLTSAFDVPHTGTDLTLYAGVRRYSHGVADRRFDYGAKVARGLDIGNINVTIERGREIDAAGRLRKRFFVMPGVELTVPHSWFRKLFRRPPPRCCEPPPKAAPSVDASAPERY